MKRGVFIVIDGIDGSGKSTHLRLLKKSLGKGVVFTNDPGGTPLGEAIRNIVLFEKLSPLATFLMFLSSRAALVEQVIEPALAKGRVVISDRFDSSTYAYQVYAGKRPEYRKLMESFSQHVLKKAKPDLYIILDSDPALATKRLLMDRKKKFNAYDKKALSYYRAVRAGFKAFKSPGSKVVFVDADRAIDEVQQDILDIVEKYV